MKIEKRQQRLYLPAAMLAEMKAEAARQERSVSWVALTALRIALPKIKQFPSRPKGSTMKKFCLLVLLPFAATAAEKIDTAAHAQATFVANSAATESISAPHGAYTFTLVGADGQVKWLERTDNTVMTLGKADVLNKYLKGSSYTAAFYLMLKHTGSINAADTMSSHSGWTEANPYSGARPTMTMAADTSTNSLAANQVSYSINATDADVKGACVTTSSTRDGTAGLLYSCTDFSVARSVVSGDTLNVTVTFTD